VKLRSLVVWLITALGDSIPIRLQVPLDR